MPKKDLHAKPFDEATLVKLDVVEGYLREWLPVFVNSRFKEVNIVDFFAGSGADSVGNPGSPIRILDAVRTYCESIQEKKLRVNLYFNELDREKFNSLKEAVKEKVPPCVSLLQIENRPFQELFWTMSGHLRNSTNLIFIDQNGIKEVNESIFRELCKFTHTDFIFFISSSYLKRFHDSDEFQKYFGWVGENPFAGVESKDVHRAVIQCYEKLIGGSGLKMIPFSIKKGTNIYGLIFCSKHQLAAEKFLQILWKVNGVNGEANFDIDDDGAKVQRHLWEPRLTKLESFEVEVQKLVLERESITNLEIYEYTIEHGFLPKHVASILKRMKEEGMIEKFDHSRIGYVQCIRDRTIVTFRRRK